MIPRSSSRHRIILWSRTYYMRLVCYENVDKFALLKDVVKNYVVNKNNLQLRSLYFTGEYTIGKLFEMTGIPIEEFSSQIAMLIIYKELFGEFVE